MATEKLLRSIRKYLELDGSSIDYSMIACDARDLLNADYAVLHLQDSAGWYITRGVAASENHLSTVSRVLGENLIGRRWYMDQEQMDFLLEGFLVSVPLRKERYNCLMPGAVARHLLSLFRIKSLFMVPVMYNGVAKGILVLLSHQPDYVPEKDTAEFFSYVLGAANARWTAERLVRAAADEQDLLFENMSGFVGKISPGGKWEYVSPSIQRITGLDSRSFIGNNCLERVHPDEQKMVQTFIDSQETYQHRHNFTVRVRHRDGQYIGLCVSARGIRSLNGDYLGTAIEAREIEADQSFDSGPLQIVTNATDGSCGSDDNAFGKDRKLKDKDSQKPCDHSEPLLSNLARWELRCKCLADASSEAMIVFEYKNGKWSYWEVNQAAEDLFGYTRAELLSEDRDSIFAHASEEDVLAQLNSRDTKSYCTDGKHKNGAIFPVAVREKYYQEGPRIFRIGIIRDLSEERKREFEMQKNEARVRGLVASLPDAVFRFNRDARLIYVNPAASEIMGVSGEDIMRISTQSSGHSQQDLNWKEKIHRVITDRTARDYQIQLDTKQGQKDVHAFLIPEFDDYDEVETVLCVLHDVTVQKSVTEALQAMNETHVRLNEQLRKANTELSVANSELQAMEDEYRKQLAVTRESEEILQRKAEEWRALAENSPDIIARYDRSKKRVFINSVVEKEMGVSVEALVGKSIFAGGMRDYVLAVLSEKIDQVLQTKRPQENFMEIETHEGVKYYHSRFMPEFGADGEVEYVLNVTRNLTDQKRAEEQVRQSEERYRFFISSFHGIAFSGDLGYRPYLFGGSVSAITGYREEAFINQEIAWPDLVHPEDQELFRAHNEVLMEQAGQRVNRIYRIIRKDGEIRWIRQFIQSIGDPSGSVTGVQGVMYDITEQVIAEEKLAETHHLLMTVLDSIDAIVCATDDRTDEILYINQYGQNLWGNVVGKKRQAFFGEMQVRNGPGSYSEAEELKDAPPQGVMAWEYYLDTHQRWFSARSNGVRWVDGRLARIEIATDITDRKQFEKELQASEERYRNLVENINDMVFELNRAGIIQYISPVCQRILGYEPKELIGRCYEELIHPDDMPAVQESFQQSIGEISETAEFRIITRQGLWKYVRSSSQHQWERGEVVGLVGIISDISEMKEAERALRESERRFRMLAENALDVIFRIELHPRTHFSYISPSVSKISGYEPQDFYRESTILERLLHQDDLARLPQLLIELGSSAKPIELQLRHASGTDIWLEIAVNAVTDGRGNLAAYEGIARDITSRKKADAEIHHLTFHDILTGLYNRTYYEQELKRLDVPRQLPLSIIICDLNGLKLINDALGHQAGDETLIQAGEILRSSCREEDVICRWGGDEFAILLPQTDEIAAADICQRISMQCGAVNTRLKVPVSLSLGHATKSESSIQTDDILKAAEDSMYRKKMQESRSIRSAIISSMLTSLGVRTQESFEHIERLKKSCSGIAAAMDLTEAEMDKLMDLCTLHDIGKISVPDEILTKTGPLDDREGQIMKNHCEYGFRIIRSMPDFVHLAEEILGYHERWDGSGYPQGLAGTEIPLLSRIFHVADAYDGMIYGSMNYDRKWIPGEAAAELVAKAGSHFDPQVVRVFVSTVLGLPDLVEVSPTKNR